MHHLITVLAAATAVLAATPITVPLVVAPNLQYTASVSIGGQKLNMIVDTGSSDAWVASTEYSCVNRTSNELLPRSTCGFGTLYDASSTFKPIDPGVHMTAVYTGQSAVSGAVGRDNWTISGVSFPAQEFGAVTLASWSPPDNFSSGILGMAYSSLTTLYNGSAASLSTNSTSSTYSPFVFSASNAGIFDPIFSLALTPTNGLLVLGGVPNISTTTPYTTVPIRNATVEKMTVYERYNIDVAAITYGRSINDTTYINSTSDLVAYVDSGNYGSQLPVAFVKNINALFDPPALESPSGLYTVACKATAPFVAFSIGNQTFVSNPASMIVNAVNVTSGMSGCISTISALEDGVGVLGHDFLTGVVAVFDVQHNTVSFASRNLSESNVGGNTTGSGGNSTMTSGVTGHAFENHEIGFFGAGMIALAMLLL